MCVLATEVTHALLVVMVACTATPFGRQTGVGHVMEVSCQALGGVAAWQATTRGGRRLVVTEVLEVPTEVELVVLHFDNEPGAQGMVWRC